VTAFGLATWINRGRLTGGAPASIGLGPIIVAPLHNGPDDKSLDVVGLMAGDWPTEGLQKTGFLSVVPTSGMYEIDSMARRGLAPARMLAVETGAGTVVTGAYYRRGDRLLFRLQVADESGRRVIGSVNAPTPVRQVVECCREKSKTG